MLIDDEPPARARMRRLLAAHPWIDIVGEAGDLASAIALCARVRPTLIFLDIQLGNADGFDLLPSLQGAPDIVFATAFSEHALRAFEVNALNYLLKPVSTERLAKALEPLRRHATERRPGSPQPMAVGDMLALHENGGLRMVRLSALISIEAEGNYTKLHLHGARPALIRRGMNEWEAILPAAAFPRLDRTLIVALAAVRTLRRHSAGLSHLHLTGRPDPLPLGRAAQERLRALLPRD
ncbi:MAG: LytTR family DNA-binding domain-containing protein [Rhodospirillales bacterium]